MNIGIILEKASLESLSPITADMVRVLEEWGVNVKLLAPLSALSDPAHLQNECELYVLKKPACKGVLSIAGILHGLGANIVNPYPVSVMLRDKIIALRILQAHDAPVPEFYVAESPEQLAPMLKRGPLIVKPYDGSQGKGIRIVSDETSLREVEAVDGLIFAQRYYPPEGRDYKIYCIGDQLFGVRRVWPARNYAEKLGEPFTLTPAMREIAMRCGQAFNVTLFGVDLIQHEGRLYVVDMSGSPGFKGVPNAALRLADYFYATAQEVRSRSVKTSGLAASRPHASHEVEYG